MAQVFISYSTADRDFVEREIVSLLRDRGIDPWYSRQEIRTADQWGRAILKGLRSCDWFLAAMSPRSAESKWVRSELHWAMENRPGKVIPVMIEECDPVEFHLELPMIQYVDFRQPTPEVVEELLRVFQTEEPQLPAEDDVSANLDCSYSPPISASSAKDYDVDSVAAHLNLTPQQVTRLANRGKFPGRKVAGQWRFSREEIDHWLEENIRPKDEAAAFVGTEVVRRSSGEEKPLIAELLRPEAIEIPLKAKTRDSVFTSIVQVAARTDWLWDPEKLAEAIREREDLCPTALDNGAAVLHPRRPMPGIVAKPFLALGRTRTGIPFGGRSGVLTDVFFLICSVDDRGHLWMLARLNRLMASSGLLEQLRRVPDASAAHLLMSRTEARLAD